MVGFIAFSLEWRESFDVISGGGTKVRFAGSIANIDGGHRQQFHAILDLTAEQEVVNPEVCELTNNCRKKTPVLIIAHTMPAWF